MFIRGSVVRYIVLPQSEVDRGLLEDATRRGELFYACMISVGVVQDACCFDQPVLRGKINCGYSCSRISRELTLLFYAQRLPTKQARLDEASTMKRRNSDRRIL
jgi:hypothetical protein